MGLKERCRFLGIGCCGGKEAKEFISLGYKGNAINGSEQDLKALGDIPKYQLQGFDGFGGHRDRALDCLERNQDFIEFIQNIEEDIIFVLFGGGGSTGSGCATIIAEMLLDERNEEGNSQRIVCPVISLPSSDEAITKHRNAFQAVQELQELEELGACFFINNDVGNVDTAKDYHYINSTFAKFLDKFISNDAYSDINNFDESERLEMLKDNGAMVLSLVGNDKEKSVMMDKLTKDGIFAPIEKNKVCEKIAIVHSGNNDKDIEKSVVISEVGKPSNVFEGYNNGKSTLIAVSGLDYPVSHVSKLGEIAQNAFEERKRNKKQSTNKLGSFAFMEDEEPKNVTQTKKKVSKLDVLKKRMKK